MLDASGHDLGREPGERRLSVFEHDGIEIHELTNALRYAIGRAGDRQSTKAVAHQNDIGQVLVFEDVDDVLDEYTEIDRGRKQMRTFAEPAEGGGQDLMPVIPQDPGDRFPAPSAVPGAVNENVGRAFTASGCIDPIVRASQFRLRR